MTSTGPIITAVVVCVFLAGLAVRWALRPDRRARARDKARAAAYWTKTAFFVATNMIPRAVASAFVSLIGILIICAFVYAAISAMAGRR